MGKSTMAQIGIAPGTQHIEAPFVQPCQRVGFPCRLCAVFLQIRLVIRRPPRALAPLTRPLHMIDTRKEHRTTIRRNHSPSAISGFLRAIETRMCRQRGTGND